MSNYGQYFHNQTDESNYDLYDDNPRYNIPSESRSDFGNKLFQISAKPKFGHENVRHNNDPLNDSSFCDNKSSKFELRNNLGLLESPIPYQISHVFQVSCGKFHVAFLCNTGKVYTLGNNEYGQLGVGREFKSVQDGFTAQNNSYTVIPKFVFGITEYVSEIS